MEGLVIFWVFFLKFPVGVKNQIVIAKEGASEIFREQYFVLLGKGIEYVFPGVNKQRAVLQVKTVVDGVEEIF